MRASTQNSLEPEIEKEIGIEIEMERRRSEKRIKEARGGEGSREDSVRLSVRRIPFEILRKHSAEYYCTHEYTKGLATAWRTKHFSAMQI